MKIIDSFASSYKEHPELTLFVLLLCTAMVGYSTMTFADKEMVETKFAAQEQAIRGLSNQLKSSMDDQKIRAIESLIFELERDIETGVARDADYSRLNTLRSDLNAVRRNL
jgi:hypothetical protein